MDKSITGTMPKKACMINIMFPVETDDEALEVKKHIDDVLTDKKDKRYTFQIVES